MERFHLDDCNTNTHNVSKMGGENVRGEMSVCLTLSLRRAVAMTHTDAKTKVKDQVKLNPDDEFQSACNHKGGGAAAMRSFAKLL